MDQVKSGCQGGDDLGEKVFGVVVRLGVWVIYNKYVKSFTNRMGKTKGPHKLKTFALSFTKL